MSFNESVEDLVAVDETGLLGSHPSWARIRLEDVCAILNGFPFSSKQFNAIGGTPLIRIRDVMRGRTETYFEGTFDPSYIVSHGDLIVGMDGDFNCALWAGVSGLLNQRVCKLSTDEKYYDLRLLAHVLPGYLRAINVKTSAITVKHLSSKTISEIPLPLPPRQEQARIVEALDSHLTRLDDAMATLERVQRNLKRYRASVLKAAVEGRLVPTEAELARKEGRAYEPASGLLERILAERRRRWEEAELAKLKGKGKLPKDDKWKAKYVEPAAPDMSELPELPEGWCWTTVDQLESGDRKSAYGVLVPGPDVQNGVPLIRVGDIRDGRVDSTSLKSIDRVIADRFAKTYLNGGELLLTLVGTIGRTAIVPANLAGANVARAVGVIPQSSLMASKWIEFWFRSPSCASSRSPRPMK